MGAAIGKVQSEVGRDQYVRPVRCLRVEEIVQQLNVGQRPVQTYAVLSEQVDVLLETVAGLDYLSGFQYSAYSGRVRGLEHQGRGVFLSGYGYKAAVLSIRLFSS